MPEYRFDDIAFNSKDKKKPTEEDKYYYIGLEHLDAGSLTVTRWGADVAPIGEKLVMRKGDVLFGKRRAYQKKVAIAPFDGIFSAHGMVLRPKESVITKDFFPLFISSDYFLDEAIKISVGSLSPTINWSDLKELKFELPPLEEQQRIATLIWAAIDTKNAYKKLLLKIDELVKSQFIEMFYEKGYPEYKLKALCTKITDGTHKTPKYQDSGITFVSAKNIIDGKLSFDDVKYITKEEFEEIQKRCMTAPGDVLMAKSGSLGTLAIVETDQPLGLFESLAVLKYDRAKLNGVFLKEQLRSDASQRQLMTGVKGVAVKHLHLNVISEVPVIVPPLAMQKQFATFVEQSDKSKFELNQAITHIDEMIKALMHR